MIGCMRVCGKCGALESEGVPFNKKGNLCRSCQSEYNRKYHAANRAAILARQERFREEHPERIQAAQAKWRGKRTVAYREYKLKVTYGLTLEQYLAMLDSQGGVCAICGRPPKTSGRPLHVDHDHACCPGKDSCGKCVRALLCGNCNRGLAAFGDDVEVMRTAIAYVSAHSPVTA